MVRSSKHSALVSGGASIRWANRLGGTFQRGTTGYLGPIPTPTLSNHPSATNHASHLDAYISKELAHGTMLCLFSHPPFYPWCQTNTPLTRPKDSMGRRVIMDLSWPAPPGHSVNRGTPRESYLGVLLKNALTLSSDHGWPHQTSGPRLLPVLLRHCQGIPPAAIGSCRLALSLLCHWWSVLCGHQPPFQSTLGGRTLSGCYGVSGETPQYYRHISPRLYRRFQGSACGILQSSGHWTFHTPEAVPYTPGHHRGLSYGIPPPPHAQ